MRLAVFLFTLLALVPVLAAPAAGQAPATPQATSVQAGGDPASAPQLPPGLYTDLIREPETLWYAVDAAPGQTVTAVFVVRGRADGPATTSSQISVEVLDGQRQASGSPGAQPFSGTGDVQVQVTGEPLPTVVEQDIAYLSVTLASPGGANDLAEFGYQLDFLVEVSGDAVERPSADPVAAAPPPMADVPQQSGGGLGDMLPVALFGFAAGGALGFEVVRKRLRSYR